MKRMIPIYLAAIAILLLLGWGGWSFLNHSGEGRSLARKQGIPYMAIMAHRGVSNLAPEATDPAYRLALELGADYLEADIQRTADGVLVCFHDDTLSRTTDVASVFPGRENDTIDKFTYAELIMLDAGSWFNQRDPDVARETYHELKILTLEELIDIAESSENRPGLYLETKSALRYPGIEKQILDVLESRGWVDRGPVDSGTETEQGSDIVDIDDSAPAESIESDGDETVTIADGPARVILQTFEEESLIIMKRLAPRVPRVYLVDEELEKKKGGWEQLINIARKNGALLGPSGYQAWPWRTVAAHRNGVLVHHYTINSAWQMVLMRLFGSDGIFTNRTDIAVRLFRHRAISDLEVYFRRIGY